jgi:hypothetical protein
MQAKQQSRRDTMVASATVQRTPRVGIVLSSYTGGGDHFGNAKFTGVPEPRPIDAELTDAQLRALTRRAMELGNHPNSSLRRIISRNDSVLLLVNRHTAPAVVSAVVEMLKESAEGIQITTLSDGGSKFSGASVVDVSGANALKMPAPGVWSRRDVEYRIPKAVLECDRLISIAPLQLDKDRPSLTIDNYRTLAATDDNSGKALDLAAMDLFGFHPAEYAVLGGSHVFRNGGRLHHNLVLAGAVPTSVDAVGAAILGLKPEAVSVIETANERGFGESNLDVIWTLGNEIEDARIRAVK